MKVLISGASGFIGSYLSKRYIENKHDVIALTRSAKNISPLIGFSDVVEYDYETKTLPKSVNNTDSTWSSRVSMLSAASSRGLLNMRVISQLLSNRTSHLRSDPAHSKVRLNVSLLRMWPKCAAFSEEDQMSNAWGPASNDLE